MDSISFCQPTGNNSAVPKFDLLLVTLAPPGTQGIPNSIRERLMQTDLTDAALVLDLCYFVGLREHHRISVDELHQLARHFGIDVSAKLLRRGLNSALFPERERPTTRQRGQPPILYCIPKLSWLRAAYSDAKRGATDILCARDFASAKAYRQGLYRAFIQRCPGQYSRRFLGKRLGISARTTANYDAPCGIRVQPFHEQTPLAAQADFDDLPPHRQLPGRDFVMIYDSAQDFQRAEQAQFVFGQSIRPYGKACPLRRYPAYRAWTQGKTVCRVRQAANFYAAA